LVAGGVESMTRAPFVVPKATTAFGRSAQMYDTTIRWRLVNPRMEAAHGTGSMPDPAQIVADEHGVSREDQDAFAWRSQERTAHAIAADLIERGEPFGVEASKAKYFESEAAVRAANLAIQAFGGYGYVDEYPVQKYLRDARVMTLYEGTSQIQKLLIGRAETGVSAFL
jgi:alkylation response protein AidB-like acyl-CoA dehydrogenase